MSPALRGIGASPHPLDPPSLHAGVVGPVRLRALSRSATLRARAPGPLRPTTPACRGRVPTPPEAPIPLLPSSKGIVKALARPGSALSKSLGRFDVKNPGRAVTLHLITKR